MELLGEIIDDIKAGKNYDSILSELIVIIKLFLKKNPNVGPKEFQKLIRTIGGTIRKECPNAFPVLNFLTRVITTSRKANSIKDSNGRIDNNKLLFRVLSENIKNRQTGGEVESVSNIIEILNDLNDFETIAEEITSIAKSHIYSNETILVYGNSELLKDFILSSLEDHEFTLIVVKNSTADNLVFSSEPKNVTYITEYSVGSIMNKVSKVFMDCHSVMADGAVINTSGSFNIAVLAKEYSVPVIVLAPLHNFTPFYAFSQESFNEFLRPQKFFSRAYSAKSIEVQIAKYDLISSDYVTILITQYGEFPNSYVYRAFAEYYGEIEYGYEF